MNLIFAAFVISEKFVIRKNKVNSEDKNEKTDAIP
jgi:hypothetical protein